jgi:hypothetical protein
MARCPADPTFCDGHHIRSAAPTVTCKHPGMEAIMPRITKLVIGTAIALAMTVASVSVVGSAVAEEVLINRHSFPVAKMDSRLSDHQKLRKYFVLR